MIQILYVTGIRTLCDVKWNFLITHNRTSIFHQDQTTFSKSFHFSTPKVIVFTHHGGSGEAWTSWKALYQCWLLSFSWYYQQPKITLFNFPSRGRSPGAAVSCRDLFSQFLWPTFQEQEGQTHLHLGALPSAPVTISPKLNRLQPSSLCCSFICLSILYMVSLFSISVN